MHCKKFGSKLSNKSLNELNDIELLPSKIEKLIDELKKDYTIIIVTHNMQQATRVADKTAFFLLGELVEFDDTEKIFNKPKLQNIFLKSYVIVFLIFWFAFLIFLTIKIIEVKAYIMCLFTIPFWIAGIYVFYKFIIKNK